MSTEPADPPIRYKSDSPAAPVRQHDTGRAPAAPSQERMIPKPLQRVLGFIILLCTVGFVSCQALVS